MGADAGTPTKIADGVVDAGAAGMALGLQSIASDGAKRCSGIAGAHEYWIGGVAVVVNGSAWSRLMCADTVAWWRGKTKARSCHGIWVGFEGHDGHTIGESEKRSNNATKRVACEPDVRVGVALCDIVVEITGGEVVVALLSEALDETSRVASISVCHAIAHLLPSVRPTLATAAGAEEIVVQLVVACRFRTIKDSHRGALQTDHDCAIVLVREDMPSQTILLPAKVLSIIEAASNLLPLPCTMLMRISVVCHPRETQHRLFIRNIRPSYLIIRPSRRRQSCSLAMYFRMFKKSVYA